MGIHLQNELLIATSATQAKVAPAKALMAFPTSNRKNEHENANDIEKAVRTGWAHDLQYEQSIDIG